MSLNIDEATKIVVERNGDMFAAHQFFVMHRAHMDKEFSDFLTKNEKEMSDDNYDTPAWKQYRVMLRDYDTVQKLITTSKYYLTKYV